MIAICTPVRDTLCHQTMVCIDSLIEHHRAAARALADREMAFSAADSVTGFSALRDPQLDHQRREQLAASYGCSKVQLRGKNVVDARNELTAFALKNPDVTHILWIDADQTFPARGLQQLLAQRQPIVSGLYYGRVPPYPPIVLRNFDASTGFTPGTMGNVYDLPTDGRLLAVDGVGGGFLLVERAVFEAPLMVAGHWWDQIGEQSEDVSFCRRAADAGYRIFVDTGLHCGHVGEIEVTPANVGRLQEYQKNRWIPAVDTGVEVPDAEGAKREIAASVIIVVDDATPIAYAQSSVTSVAAQTAPVELILIDNGCRVPIASQLNLPAWARVHRLEAAISTPAAYNYALPLTAADFLSFLTPGDIWNATRVERCLYAVFTAETDAVTHSMDVLFSNGAKYMTPKLNAWATSVEQLAALKSSPCVPLSSLLVHRRHVTARLGSMFDESLRYAHAWRFVLGIASATLIYPLADELLGIRRTRDVFVTDAERAEADAMRKMFHAGSDQHD